MDFRSIFVLKGCYFFWVASNSKSLFSSLNTQFDKYLLGYFNSLGDTGLLNIAQKISYSSNNFWLLQTV